MRIRPYALLLVPTVLSAQVQTVRSTRGDTTLVRSVGLEPASATRKVREVFNFGRESGPDHYTFGRITGARPGYDGTLWVFDAQVPALRQYDTAGTFIKQVGRGGQGPGEYPSLLAAAPMPDGGIAIMNREAHRVSIYGPTGAHLRDWRLPTPQGSAGLLSLTGGFAVDSAGLIAILLPLRILPPTETDRIPRAISAMIRFRPNGTIVDTLSPPTFAVERRMLTAGGMSMGVPYEPGEYLAYSKLGYIAGGRTDKYAIHLISWKKPVTRIERVVPRIPVGSDERAAARERLTATMRQRDPLWIWTGPDIPREKPYFTSLFADEDGRIWVKLHTASERVPDSELPPPSQVRGRTGSLPASVTRAMWRESVLYEVFAPDGRYLGRVTTPEFTYVPTVKGNTIWSFGLNANDIPVVKKYQIEPPLPR